MFSNFSHDTLMLDVKFRVYSHYLQVDLGVVLFGFARFCLCVHTMSGFLQL